MENKKIKKILFILIALILAFVVIKVVLKKINQNDDNSNPKNPDSLIVDDPDNPINPIDTAVIEIDPADYVLDNSVPKNEILKKIEKSNTKIIILKVGNDKFGFRHILMRHTFDYYKDYSPKGEPLFPKNTTGKQIIEGIEDVVKNGNEKSTDNGKYQFEKEIFLNGEKARYRLIVTDKYEIITFYKIGKKTYSDDD